MSENQPEDLARIVDFLGKIGIAVTFDSVAESFLPGILVRAGGIVLDTGKLINPGDILHEAGHIAVVPSLFRHLLEDDIDASLAPAAEEYTDTHPFMFSTPEGPAEDPVIRGLMQASEQEAQAWSYAAALAAGVDPDAVFHPGAYDGQGSSIAFGLRLSRHPGINGMRAAGMCRGKEFPQMVRWLQD